MAEGALTSASENRRPGLGVSQPRDGERAAGGSMALQDRSKKRHADCPHEYLGLDTEQLWVAPTKQVGMKQDTCVDESEILGSC